MAVAPIIPPAPPNPFAGLVKLIDATLIITGGTAFLFFMNCLFMVNLCQSLGFSWHLLSISLPDGLVECPALVLFFLLLLILGARGPEAKYFKGLVFDFSSLQKSVKYISLVCIFMAIFAAFSGMFTAWLIVTFPDDARVNFTAYGKNIDDFYLFTSNGNNYYFFKPTKNDFPTIMIIPCDKVSNLVLRPVTPAPTLPPVAPAKTPAPASAKT